MANNEIQTTTTDIPDTLEIVIHPQSPCDVTQQAADELGRYLQSVYGVNRVNQRGVGDAEIPDGNCSFHLAVAPLTSELQQTLEALGEAGPGEQEYVIAPSPQLGARACLLVAGSPSALLWAVYELVESWGVRYLFEGDVIPETPTTFSLPAQPLRRTPKIPLRTWRGMNQLPHAGVYWGVKHFAQLIDQLAKLRFNCFYWASYPYHPFVDFEWHGVTRQTAELNWGYRLPIDDRTVGRAAFEDDDTPLFDNPDFPHDGTTAEKLKAGKSLVRRVFDHARARGMKTGYQYAFTEFAAEYKDRLVEISKQDGFTPIPTEKGHMNRYGVQREGMDITYTGYMTLHNPRFVELVEAQLLAHFEQFPDLDYLVIGQAEFAAQGADAEEYWQVLRKRHRIEDTRTLDEIGREESEQVKDYYDPISPERVSQSIKSNICSLYLLDLLFNQRGMLKRKPAQTQIVFRMTTAVGSLVKQVLGPDFAIIESLDAYLVSDMARNSDRLEGVCAKVDKGHVAVSIEDDNIGICTQQTAGSIHTLMTASKKYGVTGVWGRQWLLNKLMPASYYLSQTCWQDTTPHQTYEKLFGAICGPDAVEPLIAAFECAEKLTLHNDRHGCGHSFPTPRMLSILWEQREPITKERLAALPMLDELIGLLQTARKQAVTASHRFIDQYIEQAEFTRDWLKMHVLLLEAATADQTSIEARKVGDIDTYDAKLHESVTLLDQAIALSRSALEHWALASRDRADLGALAALNEYGHKFLKTQRYLQDLHASQWAWSGEIGT